MPTARDLLEQADALMRRNRGREPEPDIPELTDKVAVAGGAVASHPPAAPPRSRAIDDETRDDDDIPELRDAIGEIEEVSINALPDETGEDSRWLDEGLGGASITGPAPDSIAVVPPATLRAPPPGASATVASPVPAPALEPIASAVLASRVAGTLSGRPAEPPPPSDPGFDAMLGMAPAEAAFEQELTPRKAPAPAATLPAAPEPGVDAPAAAATAAPPVPADDSARWVALAEEIRMQVLQRIDIFTDTGLSGELAARLQPIVDRASVDLVATINREVGHLLRAYVAEAIEREIEKWRVDNP